LRAAAGAGLVALTAVFARGRFATSATGESFETGAPAPFDDTALAGFARFAAEVVFPFLRVAIYQCTVTLSPLRPSSR
jgi:hypothetical protein